MEYTYFYLFLYLGRINSSSYYSYKKCGKILKGGENKRLGVREQHSGELPGLWLGCVCVCVFCIDPRLGSREADNPEVPKNTNKKCSKTSSPYARGQERKSLAKQKSLRQ